MNFIDKVWEQAKGYQTKLVLPEGYDERSLIAADMLIKDKVCDVTILGKESEVNQLKSKLGLNFQAEVIDPANSSKTEQYAEFFYEKRKAKGMTMEKATENMNNEVYYGAAMVELGDADSCIMGAINTTADVMRAAFTVVGAKPGIKTVSSTFLMDFGADSGFGHDGALFFSDCAVNTFPDEEVLSDIAIATADTAKMLGIEPRVAILSYSTKGSNTMDEALKMAKVTELVKSKRPDILVDGEFQVDSALSPEVCERKAPGSPIAGKANCLIFPDINAGNIGYKLAQRLTGSKAVGPVIQGLKKPINDLSRGVTGEEIALLGALQAIMIKSDS